jgi:hypothetical protein
MPEARTADGAVSPTTRVLGWSVIAVLGGGAAIVALAILALIIVVADVFVLEKSPAETSYLTVVRQKGTAQNSDGGTWYIYEMKNGSGVPSDAQLPWVAQSGDRVRVRTGRTRILHLTIPTEGPVFCPASQPCD